MDIEEVPIANPRAGKGGLEPPEEHRWKPGQSGNPNGRPKIPEALRDKKITTEEAKLRIAALFRLNTASLDKLLKDPSSEAFDLAAAAILARGIKEADPSRIEYLLNRAGCFLDKPAVQAPQKGGDDPDNGKTITHEQIMLYIEGKRN